MRFNENFLSDSSNHIILKTYHSTVAPGKRVYREHHHTECELSVFISGSGIYSVHGKTYNFSSGDIFLFGSNEAHCIIDIHEQIDLLNIQFEPRFLWENPENTELLNLFAARNSKFSHKFTDDTHLYNLILNIEKEISEKQPCYNITTKCLLLSALTHMVRNYDYIDENKVIHSSASESLKKATDYININFSQQITLKDIADVACMSDTYFSAVFKKYNGISPWDYITIKRVENAVKMIQSTNLTKLEIAEKCGFSSSSNFYKMFVKITGKKPTDFTPQ